MLGIDIIRRTESRWANSGRKTVKITNGSKQTFGPDIIHEIDQNSHVVFLVPRQYSIPNGCQIVKWMHRNHRRILPKMANAVSLREKHLHRWRSKKWSSGKVTLTLRKKWCCLWGGHSYIYGSSMSWGYLIQIPRWRAFRREITRRGKSRLEFWGRNRLAAGKLHLELSLFDVRWFRKIEVVRKHCFYTLKQMRKSTFFTIRGQLTGHELIRKMVLLPRITYFYKPWLAKVCSILQLLFVARRSIKLIQLGIPDKSHWPA